MNMNCMVCTAVEVDGCIDRQRDTVDIDKTSLVQSAQN